MESDGWFLNNRQGLELFMKVQIFLWQNTLPDCTARYNVWSSLLWCYEGERKQDEKNGYSQTENPCMCVGRCGKKVAPPKFLVRLLLSAHTIPSWEKKSVKMNVPTNDLKQGFVLYIRKSTQIPFFLSNSSRFLHLTQFFLTFEVTFNLAEYFSWLKCAYFWCHIIHSDWVDNSFFH